MTSPGCSGVALAGGENARYGGVAKGLLELGGRRIVDRVLDALRVAADERFLITNDAGIRNAVRDVAVFADARHERGSLVGVHTALLHCSDGALIVAWDMPFVSPALLSRLRALGEQARVAIVPEGPDGPEPLCAYYPRACLDVAERQLELREMRLSAFIDAIPQRLILPRDEVQRFGHAERLFANVNSPSDLDTARSIEADPAVPDGTTHFEFASPLERQ
jgi:molybdopterin-guanine dinucleotide biosynthesis protein A